MNLTLMRTQYLPECAKGNLYVEGVLLCFTLEPPLLWDESRDIVGKTCAPEGKFRVVSMLSARFSRVVPALLCVPGRTNIEIHPLNLPTQTEGCIGVGMQWIDAPEIGQSERAFSALMARLIPVWAETEIIELTVVTPWWVKCA